MDIFEEYKKTLAELISYKSVSTDPAFKDGIESTVAWLQKYLFENKFDAMRVDGYGNPIVIGKLIQDETYKTVMVYGHYDVQPASIEDGWESDPFVLTEKDGKLIARGVVDNKGQFFIHLISIIRLAREGKLRKNIIFVVEGDEETGGGGISQLFEDRPELFKADEYMISDGEMPYKPVITASFRGTTNITVKVTTAENNLHSGLYGGAAMGATTVAAKIVAAMYDEKNRLTIKGIYDNDVVPNLTEVQLCKEMDGFKKNMLTSSGVKKWFLGENDSFCQIVGFTTMIVPSGIQGGYVGTGYSNIIPASATIKLNIRIAANQTVTSVKKLVSEYLTEHTPEGATVEIVDMQSENDPIKVNINSESHKSVIKLLEEEYKDKVLIDYCGATLPIVIDIKRNFGIDPLLVSLANDDCNMHGVGENYDIGMVKKALQFSTRYFSLV